MFRLMDVRKNLAVDKLQDFHLMRTGFAFETKQICDQGRKYNCIRKLDMIQDNPWFVGSLYLCLVCPAKNRC